MYGILKARKCQATEQQYREFKAYYCGLCDALATYFGNLSRITVNYDMTFFYLLLDSLVEKSQRTTGLCPTTPWKKRDIIVNKYLHPFLGAANIYLAGLKLKDDLYDQTSVIKKISYQAFQGKMVKAAQILLDLGVDMTKVNKFFENQLIQEASGKSLADYYQVTSQGLAFLLSEGSKLLNLPEKTRLELKKLGFELGKVIYIMDSFVDYPSDTKNDRFNALAQAFGDQIQLVGNLSPEIRNEIYTVLQNSLQNTIQVIEKMDFKKNRDLLNLILQELQIKVQFLVKNTRDMEEVEKIVKSASPIYLLKHPTYFFKSRAAHRKYDRHYHHHHDCCCDCCDCDDLITTAICCDAADCDCDALECLSTGNPCELLECFC
ncbi:hypothetical protein BBF96_05730 [Anoxybacter fermentans]|uniref:Uncharacterized protein n=1 Tax=Anoxybacter fermentans TaxID=1323375 RepID=A0A3S9SXC2_9FIRM|nr:DUF5685 family protein [Anoxybacter fermentans]AZR72935.1 hypothetical protein BBF96_05730 [Anoxybacter fermentans]